MSFCAAENLLPVRAPFDLVHRLAGHERERARHRRRRQFGRDLQMLVIESEGLVIIVDLRQVRIGEDLRQDRELAALLWGDLAVLRPLPAAAPALLVLPVLRIADAGLGLDVVEPGVCHALTRGPHLLAGDRACVTADALVEVQDHRDLRADFHCAASFATSSGALAGSDSLAAGSTGAATDAFTIGSTGLEWSSQSILLSLRRITNSSRLEPTVP